MITGTLNNTRTNTVSFQKFYLVIHFFFSNFSGVLIECLKGSLSEKIRHIFCGSCYGESTGFLGSGTVEKVRNRKIENALHHGMLI